MGGHVLEKLISHEKSFKDYKLLFGNIDGDKNGAASKSFTLGDFDDMFTLRGSIANEGKRRTIPGTAPTEGVHESWDFGVLVLESATESELLALELKWLECGEGDYLNAKKGESVSIIGHPGLGAREGTQKE